MRGEERYRIKTTRASIVLLVAALIAVIVGILLIYGGMVAKDGSETTAGYFTLGVAALTVAYVPRTLQRVLQ